MLCFALFLMSEVVVDGGKWRERESFNYIATLIRFFLDFLSLLFFPAEMIHVGLL